MTDTLTTVRLHLLTWRPVVGWSWGILALSLLINFLVHAVLAQNDGGGVWTGGLASIYSVWAVWSFGMVTQVFPFALGLGITRRDFAAGTGLTLVLAAVGFALPLTVLRAVELATDGFGVNLAFFGPTGVRQDSLALQTLVYATGFVLVGTLMTSLAVVQHRWRTTGVFALILAVTFAGGAFAVLMTWQDAWGSLVDGVSGLPALVSLVLVPLAVAAVAAGAGFAGLRLATV